MRGILTQRDFRSILFVMGIAIVALTHFRCGSKSTTRDNSTGGTPISSADGNSPDVNSATPPANPTATDVATNSQTLSSVSNAALDSAVSAAASGASGAGSLGLALIGQQQNFDIPTQPNQTVAVTPGTTATQDCYLGASIVGRTTTSTPSWPESTDSTSIFVNSKADTTTAANMYIEPALLQYPVSSPTVTLTLSTPFVLASMAEVIQKDNRTITTTLADKAKTSVVTTGTFEEHRFWAAKYGINSASGAVMGCGPATGTTAKGSSGSADGTYAKVKWSDTTHQVNGLNLLARRVSTTSNSKSYLPKVKGVYATTPSTVTWSTINNGVRLTTWTTSSATSSAIANATILVQKTITHNFSRTDTQVKESSKETVTKLSGLDEVRASAPFVIQEYRDASENALAHIISSGTIYKTGTDSSGNVKWFTSLAFSNIKFDHANSTEICIPVDGTVTLTVFDKEGGTQVGQIVITYSNTASATTGKIDPSITVSGDDADSTRAQWMMLNVNRRCEFKK